MASKLKTKEIEKKVTSKKSKKTAKPKKHFNFDGVTNTEHTVVGAPKSNTKKNKPKTAVLGQPQTAPTFPELARK